MLKINFSHIFDEELERVYESFTDMRISTEIVFKDFITKLIFINGEKFDEEKNEFSLIWKNYYQIKMVVENVKKEQSFRTYTYRSLYIDKVPAEISLVFNFYWNSIDEKTVFILDFFYKDEFFGDLFKTEFDISDKNKICINAENYLASIVKGLEISNSTVINTFLENIRNCFINPKILFNTLFKEFTIICKDEQISINSEISLYLKTPHSSEPIHLIKLISDSIIISSQYCKVTFISSQKLTIPNQKLSITIKFLDKNKTLFEVNIKLLECITHETLVNLRRLWKKRISEFTNFFETKNKKKKK